MAARLRYSTAAGIICLALFAACGRTVVLAGEALPSKQRAEISRSGGVQIERVDGVEVEGSRFVVDPGTHSIRLTSRLDAKRVHSALEGILYVDTCQFQASLEPGERLRISSRFRVEKTRAMREDLLPDFHSEVSLKKTPSGENRVLGSSECVSKKDCRHANLRRVSPSGCD